MSLRLVSSSDDRALAIRDHLLPLVHESGMLECQRDVVRLLVLQQGPWLFNHWTPFSDLSPEQASSPGYRHALARQRTRPERLRCKVRPWTAKGLGMVSGGAANVSLQMATVRR